jgi:hypothetical protein
MWAAQHGEGSFALKGLNIPGAGTSDLLLVAPKRGTHIVVARSCPHAAAFAHVVGQGVGTLAHLMNTKATDAKALLAGTSYAQDSSQARRIASRLADDAKSLDLGLVFAVGFADHDGDDAIQTRLLPVLGLLNRWAMSGVPGLKLGIALWFVWLSAGEDRVEFVELPATAADPSGPSGGRGKKGP